MWFVFVAVALVLLTAGGLYVRRRLTAALRELGVGDRGIRVVRWLVVWLLFAAPVLTIVAIIVSLLLGRETLPRFDGPVSAYLLTLPFAWAALVVVQSLPWLLAIDLASFVATRVRRVIPARVRAFAILGAVGVFAIYTPVRVVAERGDVRVREHRIGTGTGAPFKIAFVADVQQDAHTDAAAAKDVYAIINAAQPDVVLSGGDWINSGPEFIEEAAAAAGHLKSRRGTFSVRGDHEHFAYVDRERSVREVEQAMQRHGIAMLDNEVRWFDHHGKRIAVVFLNYNYIFRTDRATIESLVASVKDADYSIVVTHQLDRALASLLVDKVDLILGAHTHGGQVNPVVGFLHVNLASLETPYTDGLYHAGSTTILITAGVGYSIIPLRYASPGSIEIIELRTR